MLDFNTGFRVAAIGNIVIALAMLASALWSGSTALMASAVHAFAAASSLAMIQNGRTPELASSPSAISHVWACVVAMLVFSLGAGVTITQGIERLRAPLPGHATYFGILIASAALLFHLAWRWHAPTITVPSSPVNAATAIAPDDLNPNYRTAMLVNAAGIAGCVIALAALAASQQAGHAAIEALGSIMIGLTQGFVAASLAIDTRKAVDRLRHRHISEVEVSAIAAAGASAAAAAPEMPVSLAEARPADSPLAARPSEPPKEPPKRNHPPSAPSRKAKKRRH